MIRMKKPAEHDEISAAYIAERFNLERAQEAQAAARAAAGVRDAWTIACEAEPPTLDREQWMARIEALADAKGDHTWIDKHPHTHCAMCGKKLDEKGVRRLYCDGRTNPKCKLLRNQARTAKEKQRDAENG